MSSRFSPTGCTCNCANCNLFTDDFNRADETIASGTLDSTGKWDCLGTSTPVDLWQILSNTLSINVHSGLPFNGFARPWARTQVNSYYRQIRGSVKFNGPTRTASMLLQLTVNGSATEGIELWAEANFSDATHCGSLQIRSADGSGNPAVNIIASVGIPLNTMNAGDWHRLTFCIDLDNKIASANVVTASGKTFATHCTLPSTATSGRSAVCLAYLMLNQHIAGLYQWDDFSLSQTRSPGVGAYYYSGDNHCPCCRPSSTTNGELCESFTDNFDSASLDTCSWSASSGTWTQSGGNVSVTGSGTLIHSGSWSGFDSDCLPDESTKLSATFQADSYGAVVILIIDYADSTHYHYLKITLRSDATHDDGKIELYSCCPDTLIASASVPGLDINTPLTATICWDGVNLLAGINGTTIDQDIADLGGSLTGIGSLSAPGQTVSFDSVTVSHNLFDPNCPDCTGPGGVNAGCAPFIGPIGLVPGGLKIRLEGPVCGYWSTPPASPSSLNGTYLTDPAFNKLCISDHLNLCTDLGTLNPTMQWGCAIPGDYPVISTDARAGIIFAPPCNADNPTNPGQPGSWHAACPLAIVVDLGVDNAGENWLYVMISPGLPCINAGQPVGIWRIPLGTGVRDWMSVLEHIEVPYFDSCYWCDSAYHDTENEFCPWSEYRVTIRI